MTHGSDVVTFDADAALGAAREAVDGPLYSFAVYTPDVYELLHVEDATQTFYRDREQMVAHFDQIHSYAGIDFAEIDLLTEELFPVADRVNYVTTAMDYLKFLRIYFDQEGIFLALSPDEAVTAVVEAVEAAVDGTTVDPEDAEP
ncbi:MULTISPECIES: hypothetical protein [Haloprofundus]|uniref:hypothetical protein n=1 Tax=Haloprofundus TaxID=1911573 RepID=UPI000E43C305|nr:MULTISPECIES: hypothetical protein [Haloprofundus]QCJ46174.1 hypothetical protein FCF25_03155 [Haloprofundus sp. MHR1]